MVRMVLTTMATTMDGDADDDVDDGADEDDGAITMMIIFAHVELLRSRVPSRQVCTSPLGRVPVGRFETPKLKR